MSHTARFSGFAKLLYPYHPLYGGEDGSLEIVGSRSDMLVTRLPDGSRRGIPAWMFDEEVCGSVRSASRPFIQAASLLEMIELLERTGMAVRSARDERTTSSSHDCDVEVAADTGNTALRKARDRRAHPGRKKGRMYRANSRADGDGRQSCPDPTRRNP